MSDTGEFVANAFAARHKAVDFQAGVHPVPVTGKVFGEAELSAAVEAALDFWLTSGPYTTEFEKKIAC